ncbi:hypothetical protein SAMD00079811_34920 [Scytonema sp. HK-05]|nr:hypothetical protein SAMD00079811_34920 [Scytonema sp. HK-05]
MRLYFLLYESQFLEIIDFFFYGIIYKQSVDKFVVNSEEKI